MKNITVELMTDNIQDSIDFYTNILSFKTKVIYPETNPFFVTLENNNVEIMIYSRDEFSKEIPKFKDMKIGGTIALFIEVENIKELYNRIKDKISVIQELHDTDYGTTEFSIEDNNGYILMLNQKN